MSGFAILSPSLAAGPPGWLVWAVGGTIITIGAFWAGNEVLEYERTKTAANTVPQAIPQSRACTATSTTQNCHDNRRYSVRVHAQGTDCGGTSSSTIGADSISRIGIPITVAEGLTMSNATWSRLGKRQKEIRENAKMKADNFISGGPPLGRPVNQYSFPADDRSGGKRYDVDVFGDGPSFVA